MRTPGSLIFLLLAILSVNCSKDEISPPDCKEIFYFEHLNGRLESRSLKGTVLFSWNEGPFWKYAIVPNLNISAANENVCEGNTMYGEECLKQNLGFLAEGEEVIWDSFGSIKTVEGKNVKLRFPPENTMDDIVKFCEEANLRLINY